MTGERWLLERAVALLEALMHERTRRPLVRLPAEGASLREVERAALVAALDATGWVQKAAARKLGVTPRVMNYKMTLHRLRGDDPFAGSPAVPRRRRPSRRRTSRR